VTLEDAFNIANTDALKEKLDEAGIPSDIQIVNVPDSMNLDKGVNCIPTPGVWPYQEPHMDAAARKAGLARARAELQKGIAAEINKADLPSGAVVSLTAFVGKNHRPFFVFMALTGKPDKCVPTQDFAKYAYFWHHND
jgi:hypothetical protein